MAIAQGEITELLEMIMSTTLDFDVQVLPQGVVDARVQPVLEAEIRITGTWAGVVVLHASEVLASRCAQQMFGLGSTPPSIEEVQDAFGELVNMAGGNIKGLLSENGAHLSQPIVGRGDDFAVQGPGTRQVGRFEYACDGEPLVITVLEQGPWD